MTRPQLTQLLASLWSDPHAPPSVAADAFRATATCLYGWCNPADVDRAITVAMAPISSSAPAHAIN